METIPRWKTVANSESENGDVDFVHNLTDSSVTLHPVNELGRRGEPWAMDYAQWQDFCAFIKNLQEPIQAGPARLEPTQPDVFRAQRVVSFKKAEEAPQNGDKKVYPTAGYYRALFAQKPAASPPSSLPLSYWQRQWQELVVFIKHLT
ncbi:MAG: hypothetical protein JWP57_4745 [Spirosoma sp.]|nr:hypothetical protein [Spirosoma sp.]